MTRISEFMSEMTLNWSVPIKSRPKQAGHGIACTFICKDARVNGKTWALSLNRSKWNCKCCQNFLAPKAKNTAYITLSNRFGDLEIFIIEIKINNGNETFYWDEKFAEFDNIKGNCKETTTGTTVTTIVESTTPTTNNITAKKST